jgi:hypothetical protein
MKELKPQTNTDRHRSAGIEDKTGVTLQVNDELKKSVLICVGLWLTDFSWNPTAGFRISGDYKC